MGHGRGVASGWGMGGVGLVGGEHGRSVSSVWKLEGCIYGVSVGGAWRGVSVVMCLFCIVLQRGH